MRVQLGDTDAGVKRRAEKGACRSRSRDFSEPMLERIFRDHSESYLLIISIKPLSIHILEV